MYYIWADMDLSLAVLEAERKMIEREVSTPRD
jgi:hypothetical protein